MTRIRATKLNSNLYRYKHGLQNHIINVFSYQLREISYEIISTNIILLIINFKGYNLIS